MGVVLKTCEDCGKFTRIGASKRRCKSCRHADPMKLARQHALMQSLKAGKISQQEYDEKMLAEKKPLPIRQLTAEELASYELPFDPEIITFEGTGKVDPITGKKLNGHSS